MSNHTKLYGICQNKCMVEITSKAEQEKKDSAQDSKITTLEGEVSALKTTVAGKQDTITAGTGLSKSGTTINHSNSVTEKTTYVGSATAVPRIKHDAQGHITGTSTVDIYPPTSVGTAGQYWESNGTGVGKWVTKDTVPTKDSTKAVTSGAVYTALAGKAASSHTHDDRYYTESEMDTKLSGKADASALSAKQDKINGGASTITEKDLTVDRALISNNDGKVAVSAATSKELGYLSGVTSGIQGQLDNKQSTMSAGSGISLNGATINHSNSVAKADTYVGSATKVPRIKYDAQGHITGTDTTTIYPPTTVGSEGQVWVSKGTGVGEWKTLDIATSFHNHDDRYYTESEMNTKLGAKQDNISAGSGIALDGVTIKHSNSVTAKTTYVGSATVVPRIKYDAQGHITDTSTATIYPPTSVGTDGQIWESKGTGVGEWVSKDTTPTEGSSNAVTSGGVYEALNGRVQKIDFEYTITTDGYLNIQNLQEGDIVFINLTTGSNGKYAVSFVFDSKLDTQNTLGSRVSFRTPSSGSKYIESSYIWCNKYSTYVQISCLYDKYILGETTFTSGAGRISSNTRVYVLRG